MQEIKNWKDVVQAYRHHEIFRYIYHKYEKKIRKVYGEDINYGLTDNVRVHDMDKVVLYMFCDKEKVDEFHQLTAEYIFQDYDKYLENRHTLASDIFLINKIEACLDLEATFYEQAYMEIPRCLCNEFKGKRFKDNICPFCMSKVESLMIEIPDYMNPEKIDPDLKQSLIDICQYLGLSMSFYYLQGRAVIPDKRRIKKFLDTEDYKYQLPISTNKTTEILAAVMDYLTFAESNVLELLVVNSDMAMLDEELFPFALRRATEAIKEDMEVNDNDKQGNDSEVQGTSKK